MTEEIKIIISAPRHAAIWTRFSACDMDVFTKMYVSVVRRHSILAIIPLKDTINFLNFKLLSIARRGSRCKPDRGKVRVNF